MAGLLSIAQAFVSKISEKTARAYLVPIAPNGDPERDGLAFQYFPETVQDTKSVNWSPREVPGGSLPIYQWISSGERVISFTAVFTCDVDLINPDNGGQELLDRLKSNGLDSRNVDIRAAVCWLRSFMLPTYGGSSPAGTVIPIAPKKLLLGLPCSHIGAIGGTVDPPTGGSTDEVLCFMQTCDVTFESFFPSGLPRVASVSLAFAQLAQQGASVRFPTADIMNESVKGSNDQCFSYGILPRFMAKSGKG